MSNETRMTLFSHLGELRDRLIKAFAALFVAALVSLFLFTPQLFQAVIRPMEPNVPIALRPTETIIVYFKLALIVGLVIAMPVIVYQVVRFIVPGLKDNERRYLYFLLPGATLSFALGVAFAAFVMLPFSIKYLQGFMSDIVKPTYSIDQYISFVTGMLFWVGVVFETPLIIFFLAKMGVVTPAFLSKNRKYALLLIAVLAAVITPTPDPFNMAIVMGPLMLLYGIGELLARFARPFAKPEKKDESPKTSEGAATGEDQKAAEKPVLIEGPATSEDQKAAEEPATSDEPTSSDD
jgi:sec-independent protein translocase protein TatC